MKKTEKKLVNEIVENITRVKNIANPESLAKFLDYETDKLLNLTSNKKLYCEQMIQDINFAYKKTNKKQKKALEILKYHLLGKLFYIYLANNKWLIIKNLTDNINLPDIKRELELITYSENTATLYLDSLPRTFHRYFISGIITYLYG